MKKFIKAAVVAVLFASLLLVGCKDSGGGARLEGNLLILQAYGNGGEDSPAGVSHSFVELYNKSSKAISLKGIGLYYASGIRGDNIEEDEPWNRIELDGKIPAKGSYLILGKQHDKLTDTRYRIPEGYGDVNDDDLVLNRRGFKVAIIASTADLTVQNPFNNGNPVSGYIDMVGAKNTANNDNIFGYETNPASNSASQAVRRKDLHDTDDNSEDFIAARYPDMTLEEIVVQRPRNSSEGTWSPFAAPVTTLPTNVDYTKLKLNEISGVGDDPDKFYELINTGTAAIPLQGVKIYYNANSLTGRTIPIGKGSLTWTGLSTQTINPGELFLIKGRYNFGSFTTGLTAARILVITLEAPNGTQIDKFIRAEDTEEFAITDKSLSRIPDGTGNFYFTTPTPNVKNGISTSGLTQVPDTQLNPPQDADYTGLVLNEISGEHKYVEIYNGSAQEISLAGVRMQRNDGPSGGSEYEHTETDVIPAGAYRIYLFNSFTPITLPHTGVASADGAETYTNTSTIADKNTGLNTLAAYVGWDFTSGISDQQILKIALVAPSGTPIDVFIRGDVPLAAWGNGTGVTRVRTHSYSRMADGTWAYAVPTPGAANGGKVSEIENPGYLTAQPQ